MDRIKAALDSAPKNLKVSRVLCGFKISKSCRAIKSHQLKQKTVVNYPRMPRAINRHPQTNNRVNPPNSTISGNRDETASSGNSQPTALRNSPKPKRRRSPNLTLLVGSDTLKDISTGLGNQVRVKTFNGVQTHQLEPYEKIILHIGERDVSAGADVKTLWSNMHKLLLDLQAKFTVVVSRLLPRKGYDIKAFIFKIKQLCQEYDVEFVDHHDSFEMASGEVPRYFKP